ncbi:hypothetical protein FJY63_12070 [Candidatus Sumerlaeota bacterium]|nr:hypothetical protein [Candidatus Sumerlaeota bacterium]
MADRGRPPLTRAARKWDTGLSRPYRPAPADFRDVYLRLGQDRAIEEHYRTNWRCIVRWIEECGGDDLRAERARVSGSSLKPSRRSGKARAYVLGQRLRRMEKPSFFDAELMEDGK